MIRGTGSPAANEGTSDPAAPPGPAARGRGTRAWTASLDRAVELARRFGPWAAATQAARTLAAPVLASGWITFFQRDVAPAEPPAEREGLLVGEGGLEDTAILAELAGDPGMEPEMQRRLHRGHQVFVVREAASGRLLHTRWVSREPQLIPECNLWLVPDERSAYIYDVYTATAVRGLKLTDFARQAADVDHRARGIDRVYWYVRQENHACMRALSSHTRVLVELPYVRIGSPGAPVLALALGKPKPPLMALGQLGRTQPPRRLGRAP